MSLYIFIFEFIAVILGRFEFHIWSVREVFLLLSKWHMPDKGSICCSFKFSKWRDWVPVLHKSGSGKATKASPVSGVWGCSEPPGHCQGPGPGTRLIGMPFPRWLPQGGACLFPQTCHDKEDLWDQWSYHRVFWHGWGVYVGTDSVAMAYWNYTKTWGICWVSPVQQLWLTALSDPLAPTGGHLCRSDTLFSVVTQSTVESQENEFNLLYDCILSSSSSFSYILLRQ